MKSLLILIGTVLVLHTFLVRAEVKVDVEYHKLQKVSPIFFGANTLYWVDDDLSRKNTLLQEKWKSLGFDTIRFPGGEVADNYNWKTKELSDPKSFPYSKLVSDKVSRTDFDEFMAWSRSLGAEPIIVINLETAFIENNLNKYIDLASEWVQYANIQQKYNIKYWEIGNETYHLGTRYPLTSEEYGIALKKFSEAMKTIDPTIKIGAVGPHNKTLYPIIEEFSLAEMKDLRSRLITSEKKEFKKRYKQTFKNDINKSWWSQVCHKAGDAFDFAVIHRYTGIRKADSDIVKPLRNYKETSDLSEYFYEELGYHVPIAVTEYNLARNIKLSDRVYGLTLFEMMANYLKAGVFVSNYWPVKLPDFRAMVSKDGKRVKTGFSIHTLLKENVGNHLVYSESSQSSLFTLVTYNDVSKEYIYFLVNKSLDEDLDVKVDKVPNCPSCRVSEAFKWNGKSTKINVTSSLSEIFIAAGSIVVVKVQAQESL